MNQQKQAMLLALDALQVATTPFAKDRQEVIRAIAALTTALALPDAEPLKSDLHKAAKDLLEASDMHRGPIRSVLVDNAMSALADALYADPQPAAIAPDADDSLLLCASDLQHSAIFDNLDETRACSLTVAECITRLASLSQPAIAPEILVRFCPGCGSIGPVDSKFNNCCPDGSEARFIPEALAKKCRATFKVAINAALQPVIPLELITAEYAQHVWNAALKNHKLDIS